jgi:hypothetical protein
MRYWEDSAVGETATLGQCTISEAEIVANQKGEAVMSLVSLLLYRRRSAVAGPGSSSVPAGSLP